MNSFKDVKGTKTDDFAFLTESVSQTLLPYFLVVSGIGVAFFGAVNSSLSEQSKSSLSNMGTGLTGAGLLAVNTQRDRKKDQLVIEHEYRSSEIKQANPIPENYNSSEYSMDELDLDRI